MSKPESVVFRRSAVQLTFGLAAGAIWAFLAAQTFSHGDLYFAIAMALLALFLVAEAVWGWFTPYVAFDSGDLIVRERMLTRMRRLQLASIETASRKSERVVDLSLKDGSTSSLLLGQVPRANRTALVELLQEVAGHA